MPFYPPHELPPMRSASGERGMPRATPRRIALFTVVAALVGLALAGALYWSIGNIVVVAVVPVFAALGWYLGVNPLALKSTGAWPRQGPVLW